MDANRAAGGSSRWTWVLAAGLAGAVAWKLLPESTARSAILPAASATTTWALVWFVRVRRPANPAAWRILTVGTALYAASATLWTPNVEGLFRLGPAWIGEGILLASYLTTLLAVAMLVRSRNGGQDHGGVLDAFIIATGAGVLAWILLIEPSFDAAVAVTRHLGSFLYPLVDVLLLGAAARLSLMKGGRGSPAAILLGSYVGCQLVADLLLGSAIAAGKPFSVESPAFILWILSFGFLGSAALHPSAVSLAEEVIDERQGTGGWRLAILAGLVLSAPIAELAVGSTFGPTEGAILRVITVLLFMLILLRMRGLAVSVDEHRRVLAQLRSAEALYRNLVETIPTVTYIDELQPGTAAGYRTRYMSPQIEAWVEHPPEVFVDDADLWLSLVHPDDHDRIAAAHERHYATGGPFLEEYRLVARNGREIWIRDQAAVLLDEVGRRVSQGVAHDITERRRAETAERLREAAEQADRARGELLSRVSHELRTPLNAILGFGQLLQTSDLTDDDRESAERIVRAGHRLLGLVDEILEITNASGRASQQDVVVADVASVILESIALVEPDARARGVVIDPRSRSRLSGLIDPETLRRALCRLLQHVLLDEPEGGRVEVAWSSDAQGTASILIGGTAPGISPDDLPSLFMPFNRRSADPGGVHAGPGTDLASAKRLIETMGGSVRARSDRSGRSGFEISLRTS